MGLYDGVNAAACERRCAEANFAEQMRGKAARETGTGRAPVTPESPQAVSMETGAQATATVETGITSGGIAARALAVLARFWTGNGSEM